VKEVPGWLDFSGFRWLSFDCYGTLIDWEPGILGYLQPLLRRKNIVLDDAQVLNLYSEFEPREQGGEYRSYREVLAAVVRDFARELQFAASEDEAGGLAEAIRSWQPFADTVDALRRLKRRYKLAVLSNTDDDLFGLTAPKLGVELDAVVTAQQVQSYKPAVSNFCELLRRCQVPRGQLLHVAESVYHDVVPARLLGIATVWVNRRQGNAGGATRLVKATPDLEVASVGELAEVAVAQGA
jgi:2-haloacid dehalogenase